MTSVSNRVNHVYRGNALEPVARAAEAVWG